MLIDILLSIVLVYCFYVGFKRGIIRTLFMTISLIIGLGMALKLTPFVSDLFRAADGSLAPLMPVVAFLITFIGTILLVRLAGKAMEKGLKKIKLNVVNQLTGALLMAAIGMFLYSCLLVFADKAFLISDIAKAQSHFYPILEGVPDKGFNIIRTIFPFFRDLWENLMESTKS